MQQDYSYMDQQGSTALNYAQQRQLLQNVAMVAAYNQNPTIFKARDVESILAIAQQLGLDTSSGQKKDKASLMAQAGSGLGGFVDSLLFGIVPDNWYSNYRTKTGKNIGKLTGTMGSLFFLPGISAGKGAKALLNAGREGFAASKVAYGTIGGAKAVKSTKDALALAELVGKDGATAFINAVKLAKNADGYLPMAHALVRAMQASGQIPQALGSGSDTMSPYEMQMLMGAPGMSQQAMQ